MRGHGAHLRDVRGQSEHWMDPLREPDPQVRTLLSLNKIPLQLGPLTAHPHFAETFHYNSAKVLFMHQSLPAHG